MSEEKQNDVTIEFRRGSVVVKAKIPTSPKKIFVVILLVIVFAVMLFLIGRSFIKCYLSCSESESMVVFGVKRIR